MKKYFSVILVLMLVFTVFGCGKDEMTDEESIKSTITKFYQSWEDEDIVALASCIDSEFEDEFYTKSEYVESFNKVFSEFDVKYKDLIFTNMDILSVMSAIVHVTVSLTYKTENSEVTKTINARFIMSNIGDKWLLKYSVLFY